MATSQEHGGLWRTRLSISLRPPFFCKSEFSCKDFPDSRVWREDCLDEKSSFLNRLLENRRTVKTLRALVLLCFGLMFAGSLAAGETGPDLLTPAERAWLAEHPEIVLGVGSEWAPAITRDANTLGVPPLFQSLNLAE